MLLFTVILGWIHIVHIAEELSKSTTQEERSNHMMATL